MVQKLLTIDDFCVVTFPNTQSALQAEKILQEAKQVFILVPTPREISASCGLAVKCDCNNQKEILAVLQAHNVNYGEVHHLHRKGKPSK